MKYYVITPAKNEERFISFMLESMVHQTLKPIKWIIVDDGSTDKTKEIIEGYRKKHEWIEMVSIDNKQEQKLYGSKVIRAFNVGYNLIKDKEYDFIAKFDADLSLQPDYFQQIANAFTQNNKLGICSGYIVERESDTAKAYSYRTYVPGAVKSIQTRCFKEIGGFVEANGWDGLDQLKAMYLGWEVAHIPITIIHHRPITTEYRSLSFFYNNGIAHYRLGNNFFLAVIRFILNIREKPYFLASINYFKGYLKAAISNEPKLVDEKLAKFIRAHHYKKILNFNR